MSMLRRARLRILVLAALVVAIALAVVEGLHWWRHVTVTSGWIDADFTVMGSSINGRIKRIEVRKGDVVGAGALLATMDAEIAELDVASIRSDLAKAKAERAQVDAELRAFRQDIEDRVATLRAVLTLQRREAETLRRRLGVAQETLDRKAKLVRRQTISRQTEDDARSKLLEIASDLGELETEMAENRRRIEELKGRKGEEAIYRARAAVIDQEIEKLSIRLRQSERLMEKMHIHAPLEAVVNEVYVNAGAYVEDGDKVMLLHDPKKLWVEALVDDSEVRHLAPGQPVEIDVEAYPYETFYGVVTAVGRVTVGAINGENNASRATPQIPVIVDIEPTDRQLWPGARATVNIRIR